ncbi:DUF1850 domain-containing protein [Salinisphaera sp. T31B1]|uniref:DUF1850 domain-containing protein n=1 Tax=Salinisphaera sp. T31B1 TaxID=727963 RepID=UPI00333EA131
MNRTPITARWFAAFALVVVLCLTAAACFWPRSWLVVRQADTVRYAFAGGEGTEFALRWTHSVEEEDWIEEFAMRDGHIEVVATRFKTFGAGVPSHAGRSTTLEHGWVVMRGIDRVVDPLSVQAASAEDYRMRYGSHWFELSAGHRQPILTFAAVRAPWLPMLAPAVRGWLATR